MALPPIVTGADDGRQHQSQRINFSDLQKEADGSDCWLVIKGVVYDATEFVKLHPGAAGSTLGVVNPQSLPHSSRETIINTVDAQPERARAVMPPAKSMVLLQDFEYWAQRVLSDAAWTYYRSAADQEKSYEGNFDALRRYFFRPRMLRDMSDGSTETSFMGFKSDLPIYIAPAAMAKLGHLLGEVNLTKAAAQYGIIQTVSANTSCSVEEVFEAKQESQILFYQMYIDKDRKASADILKQVEGLGAKAIVFTIDVGWESKRTLEARTNAKIPDSALGAFMASGGLQDRKLSWEDISWFRQYTSLPIIVKGVQSIEDLELSVKHGADGVMISNHGGRQVDYAPAPIDILYEIRSYRPDLFQKIDIMIDGGVRSGADVVKLLALGAKAVGFGRTFLYANGTHGEEGVKQAIEILRHEIINTMRNIGAATISDLKPEMVGPLGPWVGVNRPPYVTDRTT